MPRAVRPCVYAVPCVMLVCGASQRARSTAPTLLAREMRRSGLRPPRSAIARLRSEAVASRSGAFRIAAFRCGGGGPRGWHGRAGASAWRSLRPRLPVRLGVRASSAHERHPAWSEYLPVPPAAPWRRCAHPAARARSGPVPAARPLARYRHMSVSAVRVPRTLKMSKVSALSLNCAADNRMGARGSVLTLNCAQLWGQAPRNR